MLLAILLMLRLGGIPATLETFSVSAYADYGVTASGAITEHGVAACGPSYPFGTILLVSAKWYQCLDRGGLVTDGHLDIYMADEEAAWTWGRQRLQVVVMR